MNRIALIFAQLLVIVLEFTLNGQQLTLSAFHEAGSTDMAHLFVPFRDLTTGVRICASFEGTHHVDQAQE